jgi:hypothetical protein
LNPTSCAEDAIWETRSLWPWNAGFIRQWGKLRVLLPDESGVPTALLPNAPRTDSEKGIAFLWVVIQFLFTAVLIVHGHHCF